MELLSKQHCLDNRILVCIGPNVPKDIAQESSVAFLNVAHALFLYPTQINGGVVKMAVGCFNDRGSNPESETTIFPPHKASAPRNVMSQKSN